MKRILVIVIPVIVVFLACATRQASRTEPNPADSIFQIFPVLHPGDTTPSDAFLKFEPIVKTFWWKDAVYDIYYGYGVYFLGNTQTEKLYNIHCRLLLEAIQLWRAYPDLTDQTLVELTKCILIMRAEEYDEASIQSLIRLCVALERAAQSSP